MSSSSRHSTWALTSAHTSHGKFGSAFFPLNANARQLARLRHTVPYFLPGFCWRQCANAPGQCLSPVYQFDLGMCNACSQQRLQLIGPGFPFNNQAWLLTKVNRFLDGKAKRCPCYRDARHMFRRGIGHGWRSWTSIQWTISALSLGAVIKGCESSHCSRLLYIATTC
jgi:hypothetical protein